jgi:hypothetical protein
MAFGIDETAYVRAHGPRALDSLMQSRELAYTPFTPWLWRAFVDANGAFYVKLMRRQISVSDLPYAEASRASDAINHDMAQPADGNHILAAIMLPDAGRVVSRRALVQATVVVTQAAAEVCLWKAKHGRFPETLAEAMTSVPTDPLDLKPLRYRREGDGFVVYSVGWSLGYDGGPLKPREIEAVFRYPSRP